MRCFFFQNQHLCCTSFSVRFSFIQWLQGLLKEVGKLLEETRRATTTFSNSYISRQKIQTIEALAAIEGPEFGEGELDVVIAPPDVTVVNDEEDIDEDDMTKSKAILPDAAGKIEIHFNSVQSDDMPTTSVPKIKRSTIEKSFFFLFL